MADLSWNYTGLDPLDWHNLRDAVLAATYGRAEEIPSHLDTHPVAKLLAEWRTSGRKSLLDEAARLLAPGVENVWLFLSKS
jgi:hypothetical protein